MVEKNFNLSQEHFPPAFRHAHDRRQNENKTSTDIDLIDFDWKRLRARGNSK
jgi:hypothetical protein